MRRRNRAVRTALRLRREYAAWWRTSPNSSADPAVNGRRGDHDRCIKRVFESLVRTECEVNHEFDVRTSKPQCRCVCPHKGNPQKKAARTPYVAARNPLESVGVSGVNFADLPQFRRSGFTPANSCRLRSRFIQELFTQNSE